MPGRNVELQSPIRASAWRRISLGSWRPTGDSSIHAELELEVEPVLAYLKAIGDAGDPGNPRPRLLHFLGKVLAAAVAKQPNINSLVRFGRIYPRRDVDLFFHVARDLQCGEDLSGFVVRRADQLTLSDLARAYSDGLTDLLSGTDDRFAATKRIFGLLPGFLSRFVLDLTAFLTYTLNLHIPILGVPKDPFGGIMITYVGALGIDAAFAPIAPYTRIPMVVAVGAVRKRPVAVNGRCVVRKTIRIGFTMDHRLMEGVHFAKLIKTMRGFFEHPASLEPANLPENLPAKLSGRAETRGAA